MHVKFSVKINIKMCLKVVMLMIDFKFDGCLIRVHFQYISKD
jgi:hypothetical protein